MTLKCPEIYSPARSPNHSTGGTKPISSIIPVELQEEIHCLWDEVASYEAAETGLAVTHLLRRVAELVAAENAYWFGAVRVTDAPDDPLLGWRPRGIRYLTPLPNDETFTKDRIRSLDRGGVDEATVAHARRAGEYRSCRLCDLVSEEWFKSDTYKGYLGRGVYDSLVVAAPVSAMAEAYYGFLRMHPDDPFTEEQRDIAFYAMRGLTWFHRDALLSQGLVLARSPLTPIERRVLALLLTDQSEKVMASELGVSGSSMHTYVRDVFRKFGVSGRKGLTALWLGRQA